MDVEPQIPRVSPLHHVTPLLEPNRYKRTRLSMTSFCFFNSGGLAGVANSSRVAMLVSPNDTSSPIAKVAPERIYRCNTRLLMGGWKWNTYAAHVGEEASSPSHPSKYIQISALDACRHAGTEWAGLECRPSVTVVNILVNKAGDTTDYCCCCCWLSPETQ